MMTIFQSMSEKFYLVKGTSTPWIICEKHLKLHAIQNKEHSSNKDMF